MFSTQIFDAIRPRKVVVQGRKRELRTTNESEVFASNVGRAVVNLSRWERFWNVLENLDCHWRLGFRNYCGGPGCESWRSQDHASEAQQPDTGSAPEPRGSRSAP